MDEDSTYSNTVNTSDESSRYSEGFWDFIKELKDDLKENKNIELPREFIVIIVKLAAIDPNNKFLIKQQMVPAEVDRLKKIVFEKIIGMTEISRSMIKTQLHYRQKWMSREKVISNFREEIDQKVVPLMIEMKQSVPKHIRHYDLYYMKLIGATVYYSCMGPDTEPSVIRETQDAIQAIFNKDDISLLLTMDPKDREAELQHIINLAIGLRLSTKESGSQGEYGEFIEDLSTNLPSKIQSGMQQLQSMRSLTVERLIKYTTATYKYFMKSFSLHGGRREVSLGMVKARQGLSLVHQLSFYIRDIMNELSNEESHVNELVTQYKTIMNEVQQQNKQTSIQNTALYPKYVDLCEIWQQMLDSNTVINTFLSLSMDLMQLSEKELIQMDEFISDLINALNVRVPSEQEFFHFPTIRFDLNKMDAQGHGLKKLDYRGDMDPSYMSFCGFCVNSLVRGAGIPILANPNLGVFTWRNMNFMFASVDAAQEFAKNPAVVVKRAIAIARRWPELIILLNIESEAFDTSAQIEADGYRKFFSGLLVSKSSGMQCETHPIPSNIVESYTWNEWELRRRGIILSKIHKRRTHSTQTHWQALKKTGSCQTYSNKSVEVQTNRSVHTAIPKTKFYFAGLRGYHCGMTPHIVELTTEIPEDLHCVCKPQKKDSGLHLDIGNKHAPKKKVSVGVQ